MGERLKRADFLDRDGLRLQQPRGYVSVQNGAAIRIGQARHGNHVPFVCCLPPPDCISIGPDELLAERKQCIEDIR